jgi:hypothetical protein
MIEINRNPPPKDLAWFGALLALFFGFIGWMAWRAGMTRTSVVLWAVGASLAIIYYAWPRARRPMFIGWMYAAFPIGLAVSMTLLALTYYLIVTPVGWFVRKFKGDPMTREFNRDAPSYWVPRGPAPPAKRYFRQF